MATTCPGTITSDFVFSPAPSDDPFARLVAATVGALVVRSRRCTL
jgi:hypothetical protein